MIGRKPKILGKPKSVCCYKFLCWETRNLEESTSKLLQKASSRGRNEAVECYQLKTTSVAGQRFATVRLQGPVCSKKLTNTKVKAEVNALGIFRILHGFQLS